MTDESINNIDITASREYIKDKKILAELKEYSAVITIGVTVISAVLSASIKLFEYLITVIRFKRLNIPLSLLRETAYSNSKLILFEFFLVVFSFVVAIAITYSYIRIKNGKVTKELISLPKQLLLSIPIAIILSPYFFISNEKAGVVIVIMLLAIALEEVLFANIFSLNIYKSIHSSKDKSSLIIPAIAIVASTMFLAFILLTSTYYYKPGPAYYSIIKEAEKEFVIIEQLDDKFIIAECSYTFNEQEKNKLTVNTNNQKIVLIQDAEYERIYFDNVALNN